MSTYLDTTGFLSLSVTIWSARAKLHGNDLELKNLPPEVLVSLGSKRLYDPEKLKIFNTLKSRAASTLDKRCVRFLNGWATHQDILPELGEKLNAIKAEFYNAKDTFLMQYPTESAAWIAKFPAYSAMIAMAAPTPSAVATRFSFGWQAYHINPIAITGSDTVDALAGMHTTLYDEVANEIGDIYKASFQHRDAVTQKALRPFIALIQKVDGLTYLHPSLRHLDKALRDALMMIDQRCDNQMAVATFKSLLVSLSTPAGVAMVCGQQAIDTGVSELDTMMGISPVVAEPEPEAAIEPVVPEQPTVNPPIFMDLL